MKVCWLSAGVSSFVAGYLVKETIDKFAYIDIDDQHKDSMRFILDCESVLGKPIEILKSHYGSVDSACRAFMFLNSAYGAKCTDVLKKRVRKEWQDQYKDFDLIYVWGFDSTEQKRADRLRDAMPEFSHEFPLIELNVSKAEAHGICKRLGVLRPAMYDMGYNNNNCIGCIKGGMGYWNKIRVDFPEVFESRAKLERLIGRSCINGVFLDELDPKRGRMSDEVIPECGIACEIAEMEM